MPSKRLGPFAWISVLVGGLMLVSAALQLNDPDPWRWVALYVAGAGVSLEAARGAGSNASRRRRTFMGAVVLGLVSVVWAGLLSRSALQHLTVSHLVDSMKADTPAIEESRELFGLVLVAGWMAVVAFRLRRGQVLT